MHIRPSLAAAAAALAGLSMTAANGAGGPVQYPATKRVDHVDVYHGVRVPDPYRWLEDDRSAETAQWVEAENKVTFAFLDRIPYRQKVKQRLEQLFNYPRYTLPKHRGDYFFFTKNEGLQNQNVVYLQKGIDGKPEVLLDPNKLSPDGTVRLALFEVSKDGRYAAYALSSGGSDWHEIHVMDVSSRTELSDRLLWSKASGIAWAGHAFYYSRYPAPEKGHELSSKNEFHKVYLHQVGHPQSDDELIYEDNANPQRFHNIETTPDERFAILYISDRGKGKDGNAVYCQDLAAGEKTFAPVIAEITNDEYEVAGSAGTRLFIRTNHEAPNAKVAAFDVASGSWSDLIPQQPDPIRGVNLAGGRIVVQSSKDVTSRICVYGMDGRKENEIELPGPGTADEVSSEPDDPFLFYQYAALNYPATIFRYDIAAHKSSVFRAPVIPGFDSAELETRQVFYTSRDGTRVPMFLVYKKGLKLDGNNPTLLYGYGGFNITNHPNFQSARLALLEQGFVYASACIRGGGEYGEAWHRAGMKLQKQNVFDDFIAAAEWLIANKYTSPSKLAVQGGSNGGLLVGAVINQRPELFRAALPAVGVMDMLRFHKFTIGWNWIADYGSSDNEAEFRALYAYSPLHNVRPGVRYPATLITTADHDDRVVPAHSFKYAATMQEKASPENPVLIRIDTKSGHGASNTTKAIEQAADAYSFLFYELGVTPK